MHKSLAGIKKFLTPRQSTNSSRYEMSNNNMNMSETKRSPNLP